ncbi:ABC transporter permease [Helicovermis profundi]|uniref:ABC transporter permease n=1 Tax=Helicovermis profundi TaxID=3065157 RepID=A0AAU9E102_9FIRM|nr:ABC transporter permease [Clostridia bacterium S502]
MNFFESFAIAINAIRINKMRSLLTMFGIIIGISSVIAVVALGNGTEAAIGKEFESIGVKRIYITTDWDKDILTKDYMNHEDVNVIKNALKKDIKASSVSINFNGSVNNKTTKKEVNVSANGVSSNYQKIENLKIVKGRFIIESDINSKRFTTIVDEGLAKQIFGRTDVIGEKLVVKKGTSNLTFVIVGVYEEPKSMFSNAFGYSPPKNIYVPFTTVEKVLGIGDRVYGIDINLNKDAKVKEVISNITNLLERRHKVIGSDKYKGYSAEQNLESISKVLGILTAVVGAIAAISLLVGGIGVMNIMLVSVTERTREIGIRKALGARHKDILTQFLVEAVIISAIGGIIGTLLGILFSHILSSFVKVPPSTDIKTVAIAWLFSAGVGIIFGLYPANKASKLDPIDALRYE